MEKWEQQLKEQVNCQLPENMDIFMTQTLNELTTKHKHKRSRRRLFYTSTAITASLAFLVGMASLSPAFADAVKSIPIIGSVFELLGDDGVKRGNQLGISQKLNQQVRIGDLDVTFIESLYDGSSIHLGWIASTLNDNIFEFTSNIKFTVNGKPVWNYSSGAPALNLENGTYAGRLHIDPKEKLPDKFTLGIVSLDETTTYVEIPIERQGSYQTIPIAKSGMWKDYEMSYDALALYPTTTQLTFRLQDTYSAIGILEFMVRDEHDHVLRTTGKQSMSMTGDSSEYKYLYEPFDSQPNHVTITPYISTVYTTAKLNLDWKGRPITILQGEVGSLIILDQQWENNQLTLTFEVTGERINEQVSDIWLYDRMGNPFPRVSPPIRIEGSDTYEVTFSNVNSTESIQIATPVFNPTKYFQDLEVTVDMKKPN
ncbi:MULTISPECIES: DUF4179 domain-containing protein [Paenibacillus]|uniref:DUF4179 domain-containing protein n=1 Tax=Paenibacillus TaxID=44249 RepID=UPI000BA5C12D|nr:DUF4179 domain-containing protein [Paenibacillus sp. 7523-1]PAD32181.1 hypothetical protein CHH60_04145 [Paenibacillus sp. 7523-1]